jgi:DNA mismatch repair protein MutH
MDEPKPPSPRRLKAPSSIDDLLARAHALEGWTLDRLASAHGHAKLGSGLHFKGKAGELVERVLGASGGPGATLDFPELGVELKTIPIKPDGRPAESTFVCAIRLEDAERAEWQTSWVRQKLMRVLFVPISDDSTRMLGRALLWEPTSLQEEALQADFDDIMGLAGIGRIEDISAHIGKYLQLRPKARDGSPRALAFGADGERLRTVPRGFYLRARFTGAILRNPESLPDEA